KLIGVEEAAVDLDHNSVETGYRERRVVSSGGWKAKEMKSKRDGKERKGCDVVGLRGSGLPALMVVFWVVAARESTTAVAGGCGEGRGWRQSKLAGGGLLVSGRVASHREGGDKEAVVGLGSEKRNECPRVWGVEDYLRKIG
ncbi:hypothetical protein HAX54_025433, partial [Datura stramonium]|nr:hypothetical protein [Datura stramonium]